MPKNKRYISVRAKCPYYRSQETQKIYCAGIQPNTATVITFLYPGDRVTYEAKYCECNYTECKMFKAEESAE